MRIRELITVIMEDIRVIAEVAPDRFSIVYLGYASECPEELLDYEVVTVGVADNEQIIEVIVC